MGRNSYVLVDGAVGGIAICAMGGPEAVGELGVVIGLVNRFVIWVADRIGDVVWAGLRVGL